MKQFCITPFFKNGVHVIGQRTIKVVVPEDESQVFNNQTYSDLTIEVKGTAGSSAFPIKLMGSIDTESDPTYFEMAGINLSDFSKASSISEPGIYSYSVSGMAHLKVCVAAEGSDLTITGKFVE